MQANTKLLGESIYIRHFCISDALDLLAVRTKNRLFLQPFEPLLDDSHFTLDTQAQFIETAKWKLQQDRSYSFGIFIKDTHELIGRITLDNVVRGIWQNCTLGYFLDKAENGKGYTTQAAQLALQFAFSNVGLHRVQAAVMPNNAASLRVLEKVGFHYEGLAEYYLKINGTWEHHQIYSMTFEHWQRVNGSTFR